MERFPRLVMRDPGSSGASGWHCSSLSASCPLRRFRIRTRCPGSAETSKPETDQPTGSTPSLRFISILATKGLEVRHAPEAVPSPRR
jgi:hypothetical protein